MQNKNVPKLGTEAKKPRNSRKKAEPSETPQAVHSAAGAAVRGSADYATVRGSILSAVGAERIATDPLLADKVAEYMDFWVQRRLLAADVEERGVLVMDDRGRLTENRNVSLGVQVSKQMQVLLQQLGLFVKRPRGKEEQEEDAL